MTQNVHLDEFDLRILGALQDDARLTNQQLGERVRLSGSQCSRRRASLESRGFIRGYHAALDPDAFGFRMLAFIQVTLATHNRDNASRFRDLVAGIDAIQEAHALTGDADYLLKVVLVDLADLAALVNGKLLAHESVAHIRSSIVFERLKESRRLPLPATSKARARR